MTDENKKTPLYIFIFIGILSVFYAEVNSGSSPIWFINPWGILVVFFLYWAHLLFYVNIAIRTNRVSLSQLYLLGCLIGLYEGPITKVLYNGYPNAETAPAIMFLGFAVLEFIMLVFFWHPIFSFLLPVIIFELISVENLQQYSIHSWLEDSFFFTKPQLTKIIAIAIAVVGAVFLTVNSKFFFALLFFSGLGNLLLLFLFKKLVSQSEKNFGIQTLLLSNKWLKIVLVYLVFLYISMFFIIPSDPIPQIFPLILTGIIYLLILGLFLLSPIKLKIKSLTKPQLNYNRLIRNSWLIWFLLILILPVIPGITSVVLVIVYLFLLFFGLFIFLTRVIWIISLKLKGIKQLN